MKLFNLIATSVLGAAMAIGSGVALANMQKDVVKEVNAETNVITFKTGTNDSTKATTSTSCSSIVSAGGSYLSGNLQTATNVYASTAQGLRIGNSSAAGTIKMNLASATNVSTVVINAKRYSASKAATIGFNGSEQQSLPTDGSAKDCTFEVNSSISYIQIDSSKYLYVSSVTLNIAEGPTKYTFICCDKIDSKVGRFL